MIALCTWSANLRPSGGSNRSHFRELVAHSYSLTEAGIQVLPIKVALGAWGRAHRGGERGLRVRAELLRDGGPELAALA